METNGDGTSGSGPVVVSESVAAVEVAISELTAEPVRRSLARLVLDDAPKVSSFDALLHILAQEDHAPTVLSVAGGRIAYIVIPWPSTVFSGSRLLVACEGNVLLLAGEGVRLGCSLQTLHGEAPVTTPEGVRTAGFWLGWLSWHSREVEQVIGCEAHVAAADIDQYINRGVFEGTLEGRLEHFVACRACLGEHERALFAGVVFYRVGDRVRERVAIGA